MWTYYGLCSLALANPTLDERAIAQRLCTEYIHFAHQGRRFRRGTKITDEEDEGMLIREARSTDVQALAYVHVASWQTTYPGLLPDTTLARFTLEQRVQMWAGILRASDEKSCVFVAEEAEEVVGFASGGPERTDDPVYTGELYAIYLLATAQGRGVGRALFTSVADALVGQDRRALFVWVLDTNPACRFYEALGGVRVRTKQEEFDGVPLTEVAYGWADTGPLLARR